MNKKLKSLLLSNVSFLFGGFIMYLFFKSDNDWSSLIIGLLGINVSSLIPSNFSKLPKDKVIFAISNTFLFSIFIVLIKLLFPNILTGYNFINILITALIYGFASYFLNKKISIG